MRAEPIPGRALFPLGAGSRAAWQPLARLVAAIITHAVPGDGAWVAGR